jgi:peptide deformylase
MNCEITFNTLEELKAERLDILTVPNPTLKKKALPITEFTLELEQLARNMLYTMYLSPGIGLAGNQVGQLKKIFVLDVDYEREEVAGSDGEEYRCHSFNPHVFINPVIKDGTGKIETKEGCLSVPEIFEMVKRYEKITVEYQNLKGENCTMEADDLMAICIQHENDHLEGIVFLDRLSQLKKQFYFKKLQKRKKVYG